MLLDRALEPKVSCWLVVIDFDAIFTHFTP